MSEYGASRTYGSFAVALLLVLSGFTPTLHLTPFNPISFPFVGVNDATSNNTETVSPSTSEGTSSELATSNSITTTSSAVTSTVVTESITQSSTTDRPSATVNSTSTSATLFSTTERSNSTTTPPQHTNTTILPNTNTTSTINVTETSHTTEVSNNTLITQSTNSTVTNTTIATVSTNVTTTIAATSSVTTILAQQNRTLTVDAVQIDDYPSSGNQQASVDPNMWYAIKVSITSPTTLAHITRVEIRMHKSNVGWVESSDEQRLLGVAWRSNEGWEYLFPLGWGVAGNQPLDAGGSIAPADFGAVTGTWVFKFKWPVTSEYTAGGGWRMAVVIADDASMAATRSLTFDVNPYSTFNIRQEQSGNTVHVILTYTSNAISKIQLSATDPTDGEGHSFRASNIIVNDNSNNSNGPHQMALSTTMTDWYVGLPIAQNATIEFWLFINTPEDLPPVSYTFVYLVNLASQEPNS